MDKIWEYCKHKPGHAFSWLCTIGLILAVMPNPFPRVESSQSTRNSQRAEQQEVTSSPTLENPITNSLGDCPTDVEQRVKRLDRAMSNVFGDMVGNIWTVSELELELKLVEDVINDPRCANGAIQLRAAFDAGNQALAFGKSRQERSKEIMRQNWR